jgi:hypothetical protein
MTTVSPQAQTEFPSAIEKEQGSCWLFSVVDADDHNGVGNQPSVLARFIQHLQPALKHVDVAAAVGQCFQHRLLIYRSGLGNADGSNTRSETFRHIEHIDPVCGP